MKVKDHLGNTFDSKIEMCEYWNTDVRQFNKRASKGYSLEECLIGASQQRIKESYKHPYTDCFGTTWDTKQQMCDFYGIKYKTYMYRIRHGMSEYEALTESVGTSITAPNGIIYKSEAKMCEAYNISYVAYKARLYRGWTFEQALLTPLTISDHLGHEFNSIKEMCAFYEIAESTYRNRKSRKLSLAEILTTPSQKQSYEDHNGKMFPSVYAMTLAYNIPYSTFRHRLSVGWNLKDALEISVEEAFSSYEILLMNYLRECNKSFTFQDTSHDCVSSGGKRSRFDFAIPDVGLIEIDGEGHFRQISNWNFEKTVRDDTLKTVYCENNNIPLLRVRYDQMQDGTYAELVEDFINNPATYIMQHNKYLSEKEYYAERTKNLSVAS